MKAKQYFNENKEKYFTKDGRQVRYTSQGIIDIMEAYAVYYVSIVEELKCMNCFVEKHKNKAIRFDEFDI